MKAISQKGDKDVGFDPVFELVMNRPEGKVAFEVFESFFDLSQEHVELPEHCRIAVAEVASQQVPAFAPPDLTEFVFSQ